MIILMCNNKSSKIWGLVGSLVGHQALGLYLLHVLLKDRNLSTGLIDSGNDSDGQEERRSPKQYILTEKEVRSWRIKLVWHGMLFCGLWSLVLLPPLSSSVPGQCIQWPSHLAHCEPDWWRGRTVSCGGGTRGQPSHPPWSGHPSHWPRSSRGHPSRRGFWPAGGWCTSHTESSAQRGKGKWDQEKIKQEFG